MRKDRRALAVVLYTFLGRWGRMRVYLGGLIR